MEEKLSVGRPKNNIKKKTLGVTMPIEVFENPLLKAKIKYSSFSSYVRFLIDKDLNHEKTS